MLVSESARIFINLISVKNFFLRKALICAYGYNFGNVIYVASQNVRIIHDFNKTCMDIR